MAKNEKDITGLDEGMRATDASKEKEKENIQYICPWIELGSKICPQGLCRFWSQESHDCRWNLWLKLNILKT